MFIEDIVRAFKIIAPKARFLSTKQYDTLQEKFESVLTFLLDTRRDHPKLVFEMAYDYFQLLQDYHVRILKRKGFRFKQMDSKLGKRLYKEFVRIKGDSYWAHGAGKTGEPNKWLHTNREHDPHFIPFVVKPRLNPTLTPDELLKRLNRLPMVREK